MTHFTQADLARLMKPPGGDCVSLYIGTNPDPQKSHENTIRLKNLLARGEQELIERGMRSVVVRDVLAPGYELFSKPSPEAAGSHGLALFCCEVHFKPVFLPETVDDALFVYERFHITPLLPIVAKNSVSFYLLAVSANHVRLFKGSRSELTQLDVPQMPVNEMDTLNYQSAGRSIQAHGGVTLGKTGRATVYHGQGGADDFKKEETMEFYRPIDHAVNAHLQDQHCPLFFAGIDNLFPMYREANNYADLMDEHISGNPDRMTEQDLHAAAWPLVARQMECTTSTALGRCIRTATADPAAHELAPVLRAASSGRIDTLAVAGDKYQWGTFDATTGRMFLPKNRTRQDQELLNLAAITTIEHGGHVVVVPAAELPEQSLVAAAFRYPVTRTKAAERE